MRALRSAACVSAMLLGLGAQQASAADWSDTTIGYRYGTGFMEPGAALDVTKHIISLTYVGGYKYGVNFFTMDMLKSDDKNPAIGGTTRGAHEVYAVYNNTLSLGAVTGSPIKFGPVKDIGLQAGFDFNSKNDAFGAGLYKIIVGPKLSFDVPGLLTLGVLYYKEFNNNGIVGGTVNFDPTYMISTVWSFDFNAGLPAVFKGFLNVTGAKGKDGFGGDTKPETLLRTSLLWDVGTLAGKKGVFYAGIGLESWKNKFGNNAAVVAGSKYTTPTFNLEAKF